MVLLAQVRRLNSMEVRVCHVYDSQTARMNLVSVKSLGSPISGIWNLKDEDLRRYGRGGLGLMEYANRLLEISVRSGVSNSGA